MKIIEMDEQHIDTLVELEKICFSHPWSWQGFEVELEKENSCFAIAVEGEEILGYMGMSYVLDEGYVYNVAVFPQHRRKGVAQKLIEALTQVSMENELSFLTLEVRESNAAAIALYEKFQFEKAGIRKNFYSQPQENGVIMTKMLK